MNAFGRVLIGCTMVPIVLVLSCAGKMEWDRRLYELPGEVLQSPATPTKKLVTAFEVAEDLDRYVQPRFEILRDKSFGALRIVYRKHAGIVQLKVDSEQEKAIVANVNASGRDYAIFLLHCAPIPNRFFNPDREPSLQLLYFNQQPMITDNNRPIVSQETILLEKKIDLESIEKQAVAALPELLKAKESRAKSNDWDVLMRPVLATKQACLSCHTTAKLGDTLGVMVYAVRNAANTSASSH
jgi:hypothetical protein